MRGFAGVLSTERHLESSALSEAMRVALGPRAASCPGTLQTSSLSLSFGSLRPLEPGAAMVARHGDWVAVSDARLDDRHFLARELDCEDEDNTVLLHAYRRWGEDCVEHLRGDFAFVIWDPEEARLFMARDRFGVRPLYYAAGQGRFAFASHPTALLEIPEVDRSSSERRIAEFLTGNIPPPDQSFLSGVSRLPAAHRAVVSSTGAKVDRYWDWTPLEPGQEAKGDLPDRLAHLFTQAVARRVPDAGPVAATLSGGLDSSAIAVTMAELPRFQREPVSTYSLVFDDRAQFSERGFIESVLDTGWFDPHFLSLDLEDPFDGFDTLLAEQGGLFLAPNLRTGRDLLAGLQTGTVVLSGHGGDEVLSHGYERFHDMAQDGHWLSLFREALGVCVGQPLEALRILLGYYVGYAKQRPRIRRALVRIVRSLGERFGKVASDQILADRLRDQAGEPEKPVSSFDPAIRGPARHRAILADPMQQYALEILDRDAAAAGREVRFPFWDQDLIEFMLSVPPDQKMRGGWSRSLMRRAMKGRLPDKVRLRRDKHDFSHHLIFGLRGSEAVSGDRFERDAEVLARYLNLPGVEEHRRQVMDGPLKTAGLNAQILWRATAVAEWLRYADDNGIQIVE